MRRPFRIALLLIPLALAVSQVHGQLRLVGSDLAKSAIQALVTRPSMEGVVTADLSGSQPAVASLREDKADVALLLLAPGIQQDFTGLRRSPVAFQAILFVVNERNPIESLNAEQLRGLFGAEETSKFNRWGDLGLTGEWMNRNITVRSIAPKASLAYDYFRHTVLATPRMRPNLSTEDTFEQLFMAVRQDASSIGISPIPPASGLGVRPVAVSAATGEAAFPPTLENINLGDYKYRLPIELVYRQEKRAEVARFAAELYSDSFAMELEKAGLIPLPQQIRRQLAEDWKR